MGSSAFSVVYDSVQRMDETVSSSDDDHDLLPIRSVINKQEKADDEDDAISLPSDSDHNHYSDKDDVSDSQKTTVELEDSPPNKRRKSLATKKEIDDHPNPLQTESKPQTGPYVVFPILVPPHQKADDEDDAISLPSDSDHDHYSDKEQDDVSDSQKTTVELEHSPPNKRRKSQAIKKEIDDHPNPLKTESKPQTGPYVIFPILVPPLFGKKMSSGSREYSPDWLRSSDPTTEATSILFTVSSSDDDHDLLQLMK
nr:hypothetical protein [Tanacetum cinerariifolium]